MNRRASHLDSIIRFLTSLKVEVELRNSINLYDINIHAEYFYRDLLNLVYGLGLKNLNAQTKNAAYIDLVDQENKVAIQVTSQNDSTKIKGAVAGFFGNAANKDFRLIVLLINRDGKNYKTDFTDGGKYGFDATRDVIDVKGLLGRIENKGPDEIAAIAEFLSKQDVKFRSFTRFVPKNFPERLTYFTGREHVLRDIGEALEKHGTAALADTHGVGKTSAAVEFAHRSSGAFDTILFMRATGTEFDAFVSEIVSELGFELPVDTAPEQRLATLRGWLATNGRWLLLADNVEDVAFIKTCAFNKANGKVIYTANDEKVFAVGAQIDMPPMSDENAVLLLYKHWQNDPDAEFEDIPNEDRSALLGIAETFGNHAFSMAFVGSYLAEEDESLDEFLRAYKTKEKKLLEKYSFLTNYTHENVATAFLLRFEQISTPNDESDREKFLSTAVKDYLKLSAYLGTDNIPEELLQQCLEDLYPDKAEFTANTDFIKDIYKRFKPTSIFRRDPDARTLSTHRIVQEIMRFEIRDEEETLLQTLANVLDANFERFSFANKEMVERYLTHVGVFLENLDPDSPESSLKLENVATASLCNNYAAYFEQHGQFGKAQSYYQLFMHICERTNEISQLTLGVSYNNLALLYYKQGRYAEAEPLYKRSLKIMGKALGEDHLSTAASYNNLASLYESQGKYAEAEPLYKRSLEIMKRALGADHPDTAASYNNLAGLYESQGKYEEAEPLYKRSLEIREKALGEDHPDTAASYNNLASLYESQGKYAEAEPLYKRSLEIREKALGEDHPDTAASYNNLAGLYESQGKYAEAEPLYKRSLEIREKALGEDHPDTATSYNNLAGLYKSQGKYAEAEPLYKRSLKIREEALGEDHPSTAASYNNLAHLYWSQGKYAEAEPLYKRSLEIMKRALGEDHPSTAASYNNLAHLYWSQGKYAEAEPLYKRSLEIREKALGEDHPDTAASYFNLGALMYQKGVIKEALKLCEKALGIFQRALPEDHPTISLCQRWVDAIKNELTD